MSREGQNREQFNLPGEEVLQFAADSAWARSNFVFPLAEDQLRRNLEQISGGEEGRLLFGSYLKRIGLDYLRGAFPAAEEIFERSEGEERDLWWLVLCEIGGKQILGEASLRSAQYHRRMAEAGMEKVKVGGALLSPAARKIFYEVFGYMPEKLWAGGEDEERLGAY